MISTASLFCALLAGQPAAEVDFATGVLPWLTKSGCNAGACHGAAAGRGGMALSLWGSDPEQDYQTIVEAFEGRRIDRRQPSESLLLLKPSGRLDHGGDVALPEGSPGARQIESWIAAGAPLGKPRPLKRFEARSSRSWFVNAGEIATLQGLAHWQDGGKTDVTPVMAVTVVDPSALTVSEEEGTIQVKVKRPGRHVLLARYLDQVAPVVFDLPWQNHLIARLSPAPASPMDQDIAKNLARLRIPISEPASDGEFLRRVRLDLTGRLPTLEESEAYARSDSPNKKAEWIDRLLASPDFAEYWTLKFAKRLGLRSFPNDRKGMDAADRWIRACLEEDTPWDEMARRLLLDTGDTEVTGSAYFARMATDPKTHGEAVARVFLGVRMRCAQCHNHPLDRWTRQDYHGLAAIFARIERGKVVRLTNRGSVTDPKTGEPALPRVPAGEPLPTAGDPRQGFVTWLLDSDRTTFARAQANWIWSQLFGQGLVEPFDDLRSTNPPLHPEPIDYLAGRFRSVGYRHKALLREILLSETYGRSSRRILGQPEDARYLARFGYRRLEPEVLADAVAFVTDTPWDPEGKTATARAIRLTDGSSGTAELTALGRCSKGDGCAGTDEPGLATELMLLNRKWLNGRLTSSEGRLARMLAQGATSKEIVETFYRLALSRRPTETELSHWIGVLDQGPDQQRPDRCADFCWALLNCREFIGNH